jgi:hypothetical protein
MLPDASVTLLHPHGNARANEGHTFSLSGRVGGRVLLENTPRGLQPLESMRRMHGKDRHANPSAMYSVLGV